MSREMGQAPGEGETDLLARIMTLGGALLLAVPATATEPAMQPAHEPFLETYRELVETDTTLSRGNCTLAAQHMARRLQAAGLAPENLHVLTAPGHPKEGNLVAVYPGSDPQSGAILLLAHIDVVEVDPAEWTHDPFTLDEVDGYFHARGAADAKALAAIWVDTLVRFAKSDHRPTRTVKLALTCGEETNGAFNGAQWLAAEHRELIDADFALNEGGYGRVDDSGKVIQQTVQVGEKTFVNYRLLARNKGGHSSAPRPDNAIYALVRALLKVEGLVFPVEFTEVTRRAFTEGGKARGGDLGAAMMALARNPHDAAADSIVARDPALRSNSRTTCVATVVEAGHARNALPQRAEANVNCRVFPGHSVDEIASLLAAAIDDPEIEIAIVPPLRPAVPPPPLDPAVIDPLRDSVAKHFPGAQFGFAMSNGYTDSTFLTEAGIPSYGVPGMWTGPDGSNAHGVDEKIPVRSVYAARAFLYDLVRAFTD